MNDGDKIGIIDFGIVHFLTDEISNSLFDIVFLSLKAGHNIKNFYAMLKLTIRFVCYHKRQYKQIFETLKKDKEFEYVRFTDFSSNGLLKLINKIMSLEDIEVKQSAYTLFLSSMSGLQTIEYVNDNKSLATLTRVYMDKSIHIE